MSPKKTAFYETHKKMGAKMVEFGGWMMPVSYSGVLKEHRAVREKAGLFDVSHMGEILVEGPEALRFLQHLTCNDVSRMELGQCQYNLLMRPTGGVVDDVIVHKLSDEKYFICVNASNADKDFQWLLDHQEDFKIILKNQSDEYGQIALQGPVAQKILQPFVPQDLSHLKSFHFWQTECVFPAGTSSSPVLIARTGYTGENGFEIYCSQKEVSQLWDALVQVGSEFGLLPCGLGCRDTLRLEMGYPLYGHELSDDITPLEAALGWVVKLEKGEFLGRGILQKQKQEGVLKKRVGFVMKEEGIAREQYPIYAVPERVGWVCSGTYSPSLDKSIGCGYVPPDLSKSATQWHVEIRGKKKLAEVVPMPFYKKS